MSDKQTQQVQGQLTEDKDDKNPFRKKQQLTVNENLQRKKRKWFAE